MSLDPFLVGFLVFARVAGLLMTLPGMSAKSIPATARLALAFPLTVVLYPAVGAVPTPATVVDLVATVGTEAIIGIAMGMSVSLLFGAMGMAGDLIGTSIGLNVGAMLDPLSGAQQGAIGTLAGCLGTATFLVTGTHLRCIVALGDSLRTLPPGAAASPFAAGGVLLQAATTVAATSAQLAGPVLALVLLVNLAMLVIGRMAPNLQLFFAIGTSLTVVAGMAVLVAALPSLIGVYAHSLADAPRWMQAVLAAVAGG